MKDGFYKLDNSQLLFGPCDVYNANYTLIREEHQSHEYPVDGWYWFDTLEDACRVLGLNINDYLPKEENTPMTYGL